MQAPRGHQSGKRAIRQSRKAERPIAKRKAMQEPGAAGSLAKGGTHDAEQDG